MRRFVALVLVASLPLTGTPLFAAGPRAAGPGQGIGAVNGFVQNAQGQPVPISLIRLRDLTDAQLAGSTTTNAAGQFRLAAIPPGQYVIEVVSAAGRIVATSPALTVAGGSSVSVTITAMAVDATSVAGAGGGVNTALIVAGAAAAAGVVGIVVAKKKKHASESQ